ncbi:hypothetical protein STRAU_1219 [Streptomyces aurantiacus JA 4570]|uniref:Uncharacterized protein n=1 Tax=Streptomyces aurantiacus JA 4570 TaxID=1286094 RepID=S3ZSF8_9ACTN|nr:hypothetical protein STRAU_1219 [Streptomyces aurantiacus JA 4570]
MPGAPAEGRAPRAGEGSNDPDDINGDGYTDLLVPMPADTDQAGGGERIGVFYGSARGLDPATRTVYGGRELGLPEPMQGSRGSGADSIAGGDVVTGGTVLTADLDGDGFPDFVTETVGEWYGNINAPHMTSYISWGGPGGPRAGAEATPVRLPGSAVSGLSRVVRGDFDGDGHHDLAGLAQNRSATVLLYGPFKRSGAPARTDTRLPWKEGRLVADDIDPSGKPRATSLLIHHQQYGGEQTPSTFFQARRGRGLSADGKELRPGNAQAFGDFDGDGLRDTAVGDDGNRRVDFGHASEAPEVAGSLAVYPGSGGTPVTRRLPLTPIDVDTSYGSGGYAAADPDGDGRDAILVPTHENATLIDGEKHTEVLRQGPDRPHTPEELRHARPAGAADFNADGKDELILHWATGISYGLYGDHPTHWWITDGTTSRDQASFTTIGLVH